MAGSDERRCLWVTLGVMLCKYWGSAVWHSRWAYEFYYSLDSKEDWLCDIRLGVY